MNKRRRNSGDAGLRKLQREAEAGGPWERYRWYEALKNVGRDEEYRFQVGDKVEYVFYDAGIKYSWWIYGVVKRLYRDALMSIVGDLYDFEHEGAFIWDAEWNIELWPEGVKQRIRLLSPWDERI